MKSWPPALPSKLLHAVLFGATAAAAALGLWMSGQLTSWETATYDLRVRLLPRASPAADNIRIILLDQDSLEWGRNQLGLEWPWPRQLYARIVDFCREADAAALALDIVCTEPSSYGAGDDKALGSALRAYGRAVMPIDLHLTDGSDEHWPAWVPPATRKTEGFHAWAKGRDLTANLASFPIPEIARHAAQLGNAVGGLENGRIFRRLAPMLVFDGRDVPALPLGAYLAAHPETRLHMDTGGMHVAGGGETHLIPLDQSGRAILRYGGGLAHYAPVSAAAVIQSALQLAAGNAPQLDPADFTGKYVLFGLSTKGQFDRRSTPLDDDSPSVAVNAAFLDNLLADGFIRPVPAWCTVAFVVLMALLTGAQNLLTSRVRLGLVFSTGALALPVGLSFLLYWNGWWLPLVAPLISAATALSATGTYKYATEGRQRRFIKSAFRRYLSPEVIDQMLQHPERLRLGGERREISIFFSDIEGFTTISESLTPEKLTSVLNEYLSAMTEIIQREGGTVDKYEGDAIIAFWNAPVDQPDHAVRAVRAALECQKQLAGMRDRLREMTGHTFHMRIGLNTGPAIVGNLGCEARFDYTMLGDAVNLAARLEEANKHLGTYTILTRATYEAMAAQPGPTFPCRELVRLQVVGKKEVIDVFEPLLPDEAARRERMLADFAEGLRAYREGDFALALDRFGPLADQDPAAHRYAARCRDLLVEPPEAWSGIWILTSK